MRFWGFMIIALMACNVDTAFAAGVTKKYQQCMTATYGDTDTIQECIKDELKLQNKKLDKYYKKYLKNSGEFEENYQTQHQLWASRVNKVCRSNTSSVYAVIQQQKCILGMTVDRAGFYEKKTLTFE
ncbi:lysozyme inhibitor LprI family protein [Acinetobacter pragensis]|uniref:Lysozyme inhibitor LprI-like N-terminal domain-containing protein n=2 Tax=Acinetobacter pragensis TaxID=1806892 RepID=A0A151Y557_9GAMM|nr:lysozyme inhibitor LprI family protein [Acinetobacter pragensis]KYQ73168.1 hypothetical protein AZH43_06990 [Acinetobacter pragensis]